MTSDSIQLTIDRQPVTVSAGTTIYDAARGLGIEIPVLCHAPHMVPVGVCRVCTVDVAGARLLPAAALSDALHGAFAAAGHVPARAWLVLAAWAVVAPLVAALTFRWE